MRPTPGVATGLQTFSGSLSALGVRSGAVTTPYREPFVGESVSLFREPDAGNLPVRFDEREQETGSSQTGLRERGRKPGHTPTGRLSSLRLFSTLLPIALIDTQILGNRHTASGVLRSKGAAMTGMSGWYYLLFGGLLEIVWAISAKARPWWTLP